MRSIHTNYKLNSISHRNKIYYLISVVIILILLLIGNPSAGLTTSEPDKYTALPNTGNYNFVTAADMNDDGYDDIITGAGGYPGGDPGGLYVYLNLNGQTFVGSSEGLPGTGKNYFGSVQAIDINKDSNLDLIAAYESRWSKGDDNGIGIWFGNGAKGDTLTFTEANSPATSGSFDAAYCADINNDGILDLVGASAKGIQAWEGHHSGSTLSWTEISTGLPTSGEYTGVVLGDINGDGRLDIVAGSYNSRGISVYLCSSSGSVSWTEGHEDTNLIYSGNTFDVQLVDFNDDTKLDLVASIRGGMRAYIGNGNVGDRKNWWTDISSGLPTSGDYYQLAINDIDKDGKLDIGCNFNVWSNGGSMNGASDYAWEKRDLQLSETESVGLCVVDLNKDGYNDIIGCGWDLGVRAYNLYISSPKPEPEPPEEKFYKIQGTITDQQVGIKLANAIVRVDLESLKYTTLSDGKYDFELKNGTYELTVTADGYKAAKKIIELSGEDIVVNFQLLANSDIPESEFTLTGTIKDDTNDHPLNNVELELQPGDLKTQTDETGRFELTVSNGSYVLTITAQGYETETMNLDINGQDIIKDVALSTESLPPDEPNELDYQDEPDEPNENENENTETGFDPMAITLIILIGVIIVVLIVISFRKRTN